MDKPKIVAFKVRPHCITRALNGYCSMNYNDGDGMLETRVTSVEKKSDHYLVFVEMIGSYPFVTHKWEPWIIRDGESNNG